MQHFHPGSTCLETTSISPYYKQHLSSDHQHGHIEQEEGFPSSCVDSTLLCAFALTLEAIIQEGDALCHRRGQRRSSDQSRLCEAIHRAAAAGLCDDACLICALHIIFRIRRVAPKTITSATAPRVFTAAVMLSNKATGDCFYSVADYAKTMQISAESLRQSEVQLAARLGFDVGCSLPEYLSTMAQLFQFSGLLFIDRGISLRCGLLDAECLLPSHQQTAETQLTPVAITTAC